MEVFKFTNPNDPMKMEQGIVINGITSKTWIERYGQAGEFTFIAPVSSDIRNLLPIGSFVSHVDTQEIMIVENHEIQDQGSQESTISVTGRGFETILEQRVLGSNQAFPVSLSSSAQPQYPMAADYLDNQIVTLIINQIVAANLHDANDALNYITVQTDIGATGPNVARSLNAQDVYSAVTSLLAVGPYGIRVIRPGASSPLGAASPNVLIQIHQGVDLSSSIIFSADTGEISSADYLWSNKTLKNAALVTGQWVWTTVVPPSTTGYARRWMMVDASDLDKAYSAAPTGATLTSLVTAMQQRGNDVLAKQVNVGLTKAQIAPNTLKSAYRKDFNVGDIITVNGSYNESSKMRITEYAEIEDTNGMSSYPTLTVI